MQISETRSGLSVEYSPTANILAVVFVAALILHDHRQHAVEVRQNIHTENRLRLESKKDHLEALQESIRLVTTSGIKVNSGATFNKMEK